MNYPKISIVTPSFNQGKYLEETILSIVGQNYPNLEYIIIDGGSTDNSVEIIKKYEKHLSYWVSEKDKGQSDAINKGLKRVTGDLFNWINSDDLLEPGSLFKIAEAYNGNPDKKLFMLGLSYLEGERKTQRKLNILPSDGILFYCDPTIVQPSMFYTKSAIDIMGPLNLKLHYAMDYEWLLKFLFLYENKMVFQSDIPVSIFRLHTDAKTAHGNTHFVNDIASILYSLLKIAGLKKYSDLLKNGYKIAADYSFSLAKSNINAAFVERMIIYFLLQHAHPVFQKKQYLFAKEIMRSVDFLSFHLSGNELQWFEIMKKSTDAPFWLTFRMKRKLNHIFKSKAH